ncbi:MAG: toast rack family protein [Coprothermobacterota bacterium]|nr:toast rack family protein [Coprothermobacterota bacterium]
MVDQRKIERGEAQSVRVECQMGAGELHIKSGAQALLEAEFDYSQTSWQPIVKYSIADDRGDLSIRQPKSIQGVFHRYRWDIRLGGSIPMDLHVQLGAGKGECSLGGLDLTKLVIEMGAGDFRLDLGGSWQRDLDVRISSGVGRLVVLYPTETGAKIDVGPGSSVVNASGLKVEGRHYQNEAYSKTPATVRIDISKGIGEINLRPAR